MIEIEPREVARLRLGDEIVEVHPDELEQVAGGGGEGSMGPEAHHLFIYTDDMGRQAEWTAVEYPMGSLAHVTFQSSDFQVEDDFHFFYNHLPEDDPFEDEEPEDAAPPRPVEAATIDEDPPEISPPLPSPASLQVPEQSAGPQWTFEDGRLVPRVRPVGDDPLFLGMHAGLRGETERAIEACGTLRNKYPSLWDALGSYGAIIAQEAQAIDGTQLYIAGVVLRAEFEEAERRGSRPEEPDPELSGSERAALRRVVHLHAPFIQLTEIGSHLTALANREFRTPAEEAELTRKALGLVNGLTEHPDAVDAPMIGRVKDFLEAPDTDPTVTKKRAFSIDSLRNLTLVSGTITMLRHFPTAAPFIGGGVGGAVGGFIGGFMGVAVTELAVTRPLDDQRKRLIAHLEAVERGETTVFDPVTRMFRSLRQEFSDFIHRDGMEEWFNALHADLDHNDPEGQPEETVGPDADEEKPPKGKYRYYINQAPLEGIGYETSQWRVDDKGLDGVGSNGQDMTTREILGLSPMTDAATGEVEFQYSIVTHFAHKPWCDVDGLVEAWVHAFAYHSEAKDVDIDPDALDRTIASIPGGRGALSERTLSKVDWLREQVGDWINMEDDPEEP